MVGKTSQVEQLLRASNADDKDLASEYRYRLFKCLESAQKNLM